MCTASSRSASPGERRRARDLPPPQRRVPRGGAGAAAARAAPTRPAPARRPRHPRRAAGDDRRVRQHHDRSGPAGRLRRRPDLGHPDRCCSDRGLRLRDRRGPRPPGALGAPALASSERAVNRLRALFVSSRPLSWVNTAYPFAAAYLLTTREIDLAFVLGTIYFLIPYNLAMYGINDVFDYESDLRNPRKGGVEGAVLDRSEHRATLIAAVATNVPFLVALVLLGSPVSWLVLAISVFAVIAYSAPGLRFKERPFVDSLTSATHFVSPAVYGIALAGTVVTGPLVALLVAFFLWGIASHAFGAVQDILADRAGGIGSIATVIGAKATTRFAIAAYIASGLLLLLLPWPGTLAAILAVPYAVSIWPYRSLEDAEAERANAGWKRFLALNFLTGFLVTLLLIVFWIATV
ncbi:prenyltransferase [Rathayibacter sp. VKM Ac-2762]|nr:prenyltransferase [Rathayibacter sp. VKM Ac-2762]